MNGKMSIFLGLALLAGPALAGYRFYGASLEDSGWTASGSPLQCRLRHVIPDYGEAEFTRQAKRGTVFRLRVLRAPKRDGEAELASLAPEWKHFDRPRSLGSVPLVAGNTPLYLNNGLARRLLLELEEGMMPTLRYADWADGSDEVTVRISAINFGPAWQEFQQCEQGLLNFDFSDVQKSVFQYRVNQTGLDAAARARLDQIVRFYKLASESGSRIRKIRIDGYTDSKGLSRVNLAVARKRVAAVRDYLVKQGIPASRIVVKAHHEKDGKFSNRTAEGRIRNRRVEVSLLR